MKIIQIQVIQAYAYNGFQYPEIIGLGDDGELYRRDENHKWEKI